MRLHWTHPDWRPWRRFAEVKVEASTPLEAVAPVVNGVRLVKLPWSHPNWRPWRRWVPAEPTSGDAKRAVSDAPIEGWLHPNRLRWGRIALLFLVALGLVVGGLAGRRVWRRATSASSRFNYLTGVAEIELELKQPARAAEALEEALALRPADRRVPQALFDIHRLLGDGAAAERVARAALALNPGEATLSARLAGVLLERGDAAGAWAVVGPVTHSLIMPTFLTLDDAGRAQWLTIAGTAALRAGKPYDAEYLLRAVPRGRATPGERVRSLALLAEALVGQRRPDDARKTLEEALALAPGERGLTLLLARLLAEAGKFEAAVTLTQPLLTARAAPDPEVARTLGELLVITNRRDAARELVSRADPASAAIVAARLALVEGDLTTAEGHCARITALEPQNPLPHMIRADVALRRRDTKAAGEALQAALAARPGLIEAEVRLLDVELLSGDFDAGLTRAARLLDQAPTRPAAIRAIAALATRPQADLPDLLARLRRVRAPEDALLQAFVALFALLAGEDADGRALAALDSAVLGRALEALVQIQAGRTDGLEAVELLSRLARVNARFTPARLIVASFYEQLGRDDLAIVEVDAVLKVGSLAPARVARARLAMRAGDLERAATELSQLAPDAGALAALADVRLRQQRYPEAVPLLARLVALRPTDPAPLGVLARTQAMVGEHAAAFETLARARQQFPSAPVGYQDGVLHLLRGERDQALAAFDRAVAAGSDVRHRVGRAAVKGLLGRRAEALEELPVIERVPELEVLRGMLVRTLGGDVAPVPSTAVPTAVWSAVRGPTTSEATVAVALEVSALAVAGWTQEALALVRSRVDMTELGPLEAWWLLRVVTDPAVRVRLVQRLLDTAPTDLQVRRELALAHRLANDPDAALEVLRAGKALHPDDRGLALDLGMAYDARGQHDEAAREYELAAVGEAPSPIALNNLACILGRSPAGLPRAIDLARQALEAMPANAQAHDTLGTLLHAGGRVDEALNHLSQAVALLPADPALRTHFARTLAVRGDTLRARNHLRVALLCPREFAERAGAEALAHELDGALREKQP